MPELTYCREYLVHTYEVDFRGRARLSSLLNYLQDAAAGQAQELGFSVESLFRQGLTWVLSRYHIKIERYPFLGETVKVITWPSGRSEFYALRDYEMVDSSEEKVLAATSSWMVIGLKSKQPVPVQSLYGAEIVLPRRGLQDEFAALPSLPAVEREVEFRVEVRHLDFNRHVNNVVYVAWALEALPAGKLLSHCPVEVEVAYKAEAVYGHSILSRVYTADKANNEFWHQVVHRDNGRELARLRTRWQEARPSQPNHA